MDPVLGPRAAEIATRLCPAQIAGLVIGRAGHPGAASLGSSGTPRPLDEDTIFEIGSLTKTMTGLLLADAVGRGELQLDDPLARWLPDAAPRRAPRPVTLLDIATHTARLPGNLPGFALRVMLTNRANPFAGATRRDLERAGLGARTDNELGRRFGYSNVGFALLGLVLEAATGMTYAALLRDRLTTPLGMTDTNLKPPDRDRDRVAVGHLTQGGPINPFDAGVFNAAGGARSTIRDLLTYANAILQPERTSLGAAIRLAIERHRSVLPVSEDRAAIGLAWMHDGRRPETIWHNGGSMGMGSWLGLRPDSGSAVVLLATSGWRRVPLLTELGYAVLSEAN